MKAKRKLWLSIASFALVVVMAGAVVGVTLAALMGNVGSTFTISYKAKNVEATITAMWANMGNEEDGVTLIGYVTFDGTEKEINEKLDIDEPFKITDPEKDALYLMYQIENNGQNGFGVTVNITGIDDDSNLKVMSAGMSGGYIAGLDEIYLTPKGTERSVGGLVLMLSVEDPTKDVNVNANIEIILDGNAEDVPLYAHELLELIKDEDVSEYNETVKSITFDRYTGYEETIAGIEGIELRGMNGAKLYRKPDGDKFDVYILSDNEIYASSQQMSAFYKLTALESITFNNYNTSKITNSLGSLFSQCWALKSVDLSGWNTENIIDFSQMFADCRELQTIKGIGNWNTSKVTDMSIMFYECEKLQSLDVSGWDTSRVTDMGGMFYKCKALSELDLSGWNTSNVIHVQGSPIVNSTYNEGMFRDCSSLQTIHVSELWNMDKTVDSDYLFYGCTSLKGAVDYSETNANDKTFANYTTGYLTYKPHN